MTRFTSEELRVLAFPNSQFYEGMPNLQQAFTGGDAPGSSQCERAYFLEHAPGRPENRPVVFDHADLMGNKAADFYSFIQERLGGAGSNYHKFLLADGKPVKSFQMSDQPWWMLPDIEKILASTES